MAVSFNRYLILPEIERSEPVVGAVAAADNGAEPDRGERAYADETAATRGCCTSVVGATTIPAVTPVTVPLCVLGEVQLRFLCPDDLEEVRSLCQDWFPIGEFSDARIRKGVFCVSKLFSASKMEDIWDRTVFSEIQ